MSQRIKRYSTTYLNDQRLYYAEIERQAVVVLEPVEYYAQGFLPPAPAAIITLLYRINDMSFYMILEPKFDDSAKIELVRFLL
jgi:hypothetical protein